VERMHEEKDSRLIWIDLETTGLDPDRHVIIEIAVIVTGPDLVEVAEPLCRLAYPSRKSLDVMDPMVREMHETSGLLAEYFDEYERNPYLFGEGRIGARTVESKVLEYLQEYTAPGACPLAGSSVHFDRAFLARWMPRVHAYLHYRNFDV